jgi:hypothetical protein
MDLKKLSEPLRIEDIDFRVQSINGGGYATILAYKDARVDMARLDEVVGHLNWKREHVNGNANCIVSIWDETKKEWVSKEDTGTESNTEKAKGLASDSFKRACFNWGIGRELYDYPLIQVKLFPNEFDQATKKPTWDFKLKEWKWLTCFENGKLTKMTAYDQNNKERFSYGNIPTPKPKPMFTTEMFEKAHKANASIDKIKGSYTVTSEVEKAYNLFIQANK